MDADNIEEHAKQNVFSSPEESTENASESLRGKNLRQEGGASQRDGEREVLVVSGIVNPKPSFHFDLFRFHSKRFQN